METKRKALGKGLEQLFSNEVINFDKLEANIIESTGEGKKSPLNEVNVDEVRSNPFQPRKAFNDDSLQELADSIKEHGVIEPIIVKKSIKGYELVAGERRLRAAKLAGLKSVPCVIRDFDDAEMMEIALLENIQREDLNPIEEAEAYQKIMELSHLSYDEFAKKFGKSKSYVVNMVGLLKLPEIVKEYTVDRKLSMAHARSLSKITDKKLCIELAEKVINNGISAHALEDIIREMNENSEEKVTKTKVQRPLKINIYERLMREKVGTKVKIKAKKLEIPFDSDEDLERILETLGIKVEGIE